FLEEVPDLMLSTLYLYMLVRIKFSSDQNFKTPFFTLFVSTGLCGLISVVSHICIAKFTYNEHMLWAFQLAWIINYMGAIGSTIGKLLIVVHRFEVLRSVELKENVSFFTYFFLLY
ncbi:hypothetical protein PFISCL1PPCAC_26852, partial [Pristionchus fissidentatus]